MNALMRGTAVWIGMGMLALAVLSGQARADVKSKLAQEAADYVLQRFGRTVVKEGAETLAAKIESYAARHGDDFFLAVKRCGPQAFRLVEEGAEHGSQVARLLAKHGESAAWVLSRPKGMSLFLQHGDEAVVTLIRHKGVAEPIIEQLGLPAMKALQVVGPRSGRRLAMMLESGELAQMGSTPELMSVIEKYGEPAMDFVWANKGSLLVGTTLAAFLIDPEPFISGAKSVTQTVAETAIKPIAEVPLTVVTEGTGEIARRTNWTLLFLVAMGVVSLFIAAKRGLFTRVAPVLPQNPETKGGVQ